MNILIKDVDIKIEKLPKFKTIKKHDFRLPSTLQYRWTIHEGKKIFTYGYTHTEKQAKEAASRAYVYVTEKKSRNTLEMGGNCEN